MKPSQPGRPEHTSGISELVFQDRGADLLMKGIVTDSFQASGAASLALEALYKSPLDKVHPKI
ncbi:MAG: hypothetical protein D3926_03650 [Desulfobacteraceae bacterium]|nr:MAG: hypothetical protein D3926_03650 [Desulfobacteraceae bacterium]